jgi:tetratricopeptide (TPR) repeat protein
VADDSLRNRQKLEAQIQRWTADAKKLTESGKEAAALELYRKAADELPGAPWLQHRTGELARKLKQNDVAIVYYRRASTAFQIADFGKRAVAPLRTAWSLAIDGLPGTSKVMVDLAAELMQLHRRLGFAADATVVFERTNAALRAVGFSEMPRQLLEALRHERISGPPTRPSSMPPSSQPPSTPPPSTRPESRLSSVPPQSDVTPRGSGRPEPPSSSSSRARALARLFGRR